MKKLIAAAALAMTPLTPAWAEPDPSDWEAVLAEASGQTVYWNAWGGAAHINDFIDWLGDEVEARYGVSVEHVKLTDTEAGIVLSGDDDGDKYADHAKDHCEDGGPLCHVSGFPAALLCPECPQQRPK